MLKKLNVLAAAYRLRTFTVGELAAESGIGEQTVRTVLGRAPKDWWTSEVLSAGTRGGQPFRYELTNAGRAGIEETVGRLPISRSLAPGPATADVEPVGLSSARDSIERAQKTRNPTVANSLRASAIDNLNWALAELDDGAFRDGAKQLRAEIERLFAAARSRAMSEFPDEFPYVAIDQPSRKIPDRSLEVPDAARTWKAFRPAGRFRRIVIGYFGAGALKMASFAHGAIATSARASGRKLQIDEPVEAHKLVAAVERVRHRESAENMMVFVCVAKGGHTAEVESVIARMRALKLYTCVLDRGHNAGVANVSKRLDVDYQPNASTVEDLAWLSITNGV